MHGLRNEAHCAASRWSSSVPQSPVQYLKYVLLFDTLTVLTPQRHGPYPLLDCAFLQRHREGGSSAWASMDGADCGECGWATCMCRMIKRAANDIKYGVTGASIRAQLTKRCSSPCCPKQEPRIFGDLQASWSTWPPLTVPKSLCCDPAQPKAMAIASFGRPSLARSHSGWVSCHGVLNVWNAMAVRAFGSLHAQGRRRLELV